MKKTSLIISILCCTCLMACGTPNESKNPAETVIPETTVTNTLAPTNKPTETLATTATDTPVPTNAPTPTNTPKPTATSAPTPTVTNTPTPVPTKAPIVVELPDDIYSFQIALDNDVYQFPMWISDFEAMGWKYAEKETGELKPDYYTSAYWEKDGLNCYSQIFNFTINTLPYNQCAIAGINVDKYDLEELGVTVTLPKGIQTGVATKEDILAAYGTPTSEYEGNSYYKAEYKYDTYQKISLYVYKESGVLEQVDICNLTDLEGGNNEVSYAIPDYVMNYQEPTSMEDTNYDMVFALDGGIYNMPCPVSSFIADGFVVDLEKSDEYIASAKSGTVVLTKGNVSISCRAYNYAKYATYIQNCFVTGIDVYSDKFNLTMLESIKVGTSEEDVLKAIEGLNYQEKEYGTNERSFKIFSPEEGEYGDYYYISCKDGVVVMMSLRNGTVPKGEGNPTEFISEPLVQVGEEGIYSYQVTIDGELYQFPMWFSEFEAKGWAYKEDATEKLKPNVYDSYLTWEKDGVKVYTTLYNLTINTALMNQCAVAGMEIDRYDIKDSKMTLELPMGIVFGVSTKEDIIAAYGVPTREYDGESFWQLTYQKEYHERVELTIHKDNGVLSGISIENMIELEGGNNEVSTEVPNCVKEYIQPKEFGSNFYDMIFALDGVFYSMPCPMSLLLQNGFIFHADSKDVIVPAGTTQMVTIIYNNISMRCAVTNHSECAVSVENCFLSNIVASDFTSQLNLEITGGIKRGSTEAELLQVIKDWNYTVSETDNSANYSIWDPNGRISNCYSIYVKDGVVASIEITNYRLQEE